MTATAPINMTVEYTNPALREEAVKHRERWIVDAAAYRAAAGPRAELAVAYGDQARQRLDLFTPTSGERGPVAMFLHGGYWQSLDQSFFSHLARGANAHGITVAVCGYTLCPEATLAAIIEEVRQAVRFLAKRFGRPITVCGHSAGGHLTACMLATDWRTYASELAADPAPTGLSISGLFELEPLLSTPVNIRLALDVEEARRLSPLLWQPLPSKSMIAYVGGNESSEYLRQTRSLVTRWSAAGVTMRGVEVAGTNHFTVLAPLADPESPLTQDLVTLARAP